MRLTRNRVHCLQCDEIIESTHRHDYKHCKCGNAMVDGGLAYERYGARDGWDTIETMFDYEEEKEDD